MKPKSKKDEYIVKTNSTWQTEKVGSLIFGKETRLGQWNFVIKKNGIKESEVVTNFLYRNYQIPIISFEEWLRLPDYAPEEVADKEFVLPENWCVKVNKDNENLLTNWKINKNKELTDKASEWDYVGFEGSGVPQSYIDDGEYTEITFDQFKKHVLGEDIEHPQKELFETKCGGTYFLNTHRPIIGYKLVKEEYKEAAQLIAFSNLEFLTDNSFVNVKQCHFFKESQVEENLEKAGVMHWFEPVYEEEKITLKSGVELSQAGIEEVKQILNETT